MKACRPFVPVALENRHRKGFRKGQGLSVTISSWQVGSKGFFPLEKKGRSDSESMQ